MRKTACGSVLTVLLIGLVTGLVPALASEAEERSPIPAGGPAEVSEEKRAAEIESWEAERARSSLTKRAESQTAFEDLPRDDAASLAQDNFKDYFDSLAEPILAEPGDEIRSYENDHVAIVDPEGKDPNQLMVSSLPLRVEDESGKTEPVDLELDRSGDAYEPGAIGTELSFPTELEDGIEIGEEGVAIGVSDPEEASAPKQIERSDSLFYADVATDTDLVVSPTTGGFRFALQLRSEQSPERIALPIELPAGADLDTDSKTGFVEIDPSGPSEIVITAPVAFDADGRPVESRFEAKGDELVLIVEHRDGNPRMPILVDPVVYQSQIVSDDYFDDSPTSRGWGYWESDPYGYNTAYQGFWGELFGTGTGTGGLFTYLPPSGLVWANSHGMWYENVPNYGSTSAYYNYVKFQDIGFAVVGGGGYYPFLDFGVVSPYYGYGNWRNTWYGQFNESYFWMGPINDSSYKQIQFDLNSGSQGAWLTNQQYRYGYLGGITTYIGDTEWPSVSASSLPSSAWTSSPPASTSFTMNASDGGLGIKTTVMRAGETPPTTRSPNCAGWHSASACPQVPNESFRQLGFNQAALGDGVHHLYGRAIDVVDKDTGWVSVGTVRNDRTNPNQPALSGPLAPGSTQQGNTLTVHGSDTHSGVRSISMKIDGQPVDPAAVSGGEPQDCPNVSAGGCSQTLTYTASSASPFYAPGNHTMSVTVTDQVGHTSSRTWNKVNTPANCETLNADELARLELSPLADAPYEYQEWLASDEAQAAVEVIQGVLEGEFGVEASPEANLAAGYIGVSVDHLNQQLRVVIDSNLVNAVPLQQSLDGALSSAGLNSSLDVTVNSGCNGGEELSDAYEYVDSHDWVVASENPGFGYYVDSARSRIEVELEPGATQSKQNLENNLGDLVRVITTGEPAYYSKVRDEEPHKGGAGIGSANQGNFCTSGFVAKLPSGELGAVTAGHCFNDGDSVRSGPANDSVFYGQAAGESGYPQFDMIRIQPQGQSFQRKLWTEGPTPADVSGAGNPAHGSMVCVSGVATKQVCGVEVGTLDGKLCPKGTGGECTVNLAKARKPRVRVAGRGDSGGPIYQQFGNNARIKGIVNGGNPNLGGEFGDNVFFHKVNTIKDHLNVTDIGG